MSAMDFGARSIAAQARLRADAAARGPARPLVRIVHSRALNIATVGAGNTTYEALIELAAPFSRIQPILCVGQNAGGTATSPTYYVWAAAVPNATKTAADAASWITLNMQTANLTPAAQLNKRAWHVANGLQALPSVARDDGGSGRLLLIRVVVAPGTWVLLGNGTDSFTNWAGRSSRMYRWREQAGTHGAASPATFTSTTNQSRSPIAGVAYMPTDGRGVTVAGVGDSNAVGSGTFMGANHMFQACELLTARDGVPHEYADLAWGGFASDAIRMSVVDLFGPAGLFNAATGLMPSVMHLPTATQNDWAQGPTASTITDATVAVMEANLAQARSVIAAAGVPLIRSTWQGSAVRNWGASDSVRRARNDAWRAASPLNGDLMVDVASVVDDVPNGSGQAPVKAIYDQDTAHFNDAGHAAIAPLSARAIAAAVPVPRGAVFA